MGPPVSAEAGNDRGPRASIDINSDVGELDDDGHTDDQLLEVITSANIACGGHAGDRASMSRICRVAIARDVAIGAQVSYPDRDGFGRRRIPMNLSELRSSLHRQFDELAEAAANHGGWVTYIKPHGALYHAALDDAEIADVLVELAALQRVSLLTMDDGQLHARAVEAGLASFHEAFIDRGYTSEGRLAPRDTPGAVLDAVTALNRLRQWLESGVGHIDSLCVHSDSPDAVQMVRESRRVIDECGIEIAPFAPRVGSDGLAEPRQGEHGT